MVLSPRIYTLSPQSPDWKYLREAAQILRHGGLVAFPTETVYGLGADATNPEAIERLNAIKKRPLHKPYSWHLGSVSQLLDFVPSIPPVAQRLIDRFWPGPLTIVLPTREGQTLGFRVPDHPVAQAFLEACGVPVAAPSANRSGEVPPTDAAQVIAALDGAVDGILDAGPTSLGRESSVVEVRANQITLHREGSIAREAIASTIVPFELRDPAKQDF